MTGDRDLNDPWAPRPRGSRLGNTLITVAGADRTELDGRSVDRSYYIGMGSALLLAATISAVAMTTATSIAFGVRIDSPPLIIAGLVYFGLILGLDRWLVSDQTTGFVNETHSTVSVAVAWFRHFMVELLKIAPRIFLAFLSSLLFANFLMLAIFDHEIQQQLNKMQQQRLAQYDQQITAVANNIKNQADGVISQAQTAEQRTQEEFNTDQQVLHQAYKTEQRSLTTLHKQGINCTEQATFVVETNPNTGLKQTVFTGDTLVCPPQITAVISTYNGIVADYPQTQAGVDQKKAQIARQYGVRAQRQIIKNATAAAQKQMKPYTPKKADGLLARIQALQLLTTKPAGTCPPTPSVADLANNVACTSQYSAYAAGLHITLRLWLLAFELAPVGLKFINSLLPRRGYAWAMAARDTEKVGKARLKMGKALLEEQTDLATFVRREHARLEEEGALQEYKLRELARNERRLDVRRIRTRFTAALANSEPTRVWKGRRDLRGRGAAVPGNVVPMTSYVDPRNTQADPGVRIIESEDFLY
jgi:hypothetical protein